MCAQVMIVSCKPASPCREAACQPPAQALENMRRCDRAIASAALDGATPLHCAAAMGSRGTVKLLLLSGACASTTTAAGMHSLPYLQTLCQRLRFPPTRVCSESQPPLVCIDLVIDTA